MQELGIPSLRKLDAGVWTSGQPDAAQLRAARAAGLTGLESAVRSIIVQTGDQS